MVYIYETTDFVRKFVNQKTPCTYVIEVTEKKRKRNKLLLTVFFVF